MIPVSCKAPRYDLSELKLVGDYNRSNVLVAAAIAEAAGVPREVIQATIPRLAPRWGRLERVCNPAVKAEVYVDFAHTPDGLAKVLAAVRGEMERRGLAGSLWVVFGAGGDRDPMKRPLMGEACARGADRLVVTSDNPRGEEPMSIIRQILAGIDGANESVAVEPDRAKAIAYALFLRNIPHKLWSHAYRKLGYGDLEKPCCDIMTELMYKYQKTEYQDRYQDSY